MTPKEIITEALYNIYGTSTPDESIQSRAGTVLTRIYDQVQRKAPWWFLRQEIISTSANTDLSEFHTDGVVKINGTPAYMVKLKGAVGVIVVESQWKSYYEVFDDMTMAKNKWIGISSGCPLISDRGADTVYQVDSSNNKLLEISDTGHIINEYSFSGNAYAMSASNRVFYFGSGPSIRSFDLTTKTYGIILTGSYAIQLTVATPIGILYLCVNQLGRYETHFYSFSTGEDVILFTSVQNTFLYGLYDGKCITLYSNTMAQQLDVSEEGVSIIATYPIPDRSVASHQLTGDSDCLYSFIQIDGDYYLHRMSKRQVGNIFSIKNDDGSRVTRIKDFELNKYRGIVGKTAQYYTDQQTVKKNRILSFYPEAAEKYIHIDAVVYSEYDEDSEDAVVANLDDYLTKKLTSELSLISEYADRYQAYSEAAELSLQVAISQNCNFTAQELEPGYSEC